MKRGDGLGSPGEGSDFDEDFADLIELNGYSVSRSARSGEGGSELIATRDDEVGHKITYVIHLKASGAVDDEDVERVVKARDRYLGSISVVVSPSSGFSRSVADLAGRRGVRLWGEEEIRRLRRNVADKRGLRRRDAADGSDPRGRRKSRSRGKVAVLLVVLAAALLYMHFFGTGVGPLRTALIDLGDRAEEIWRVGAPPLRDGLVLVRDRILDLLRG